MTIQPKQIFTNNKTGKRVMVRWDWTDYAKSAGYVQFNGIDEGGDKVGPLLSSKIEKFLATYTAAE
jgi:hypothetical protein